MRSSIKICSLSCALVLALSTACADPRLAKAKAAAKSSLPPAVAAGFSERVDAKGARFLELLAAAEKDYKAVPDLLLRVDKERSLSEDYQPTDLVGLDGKGLSVSREGFRLRQPAFLAFKAMNAAALADGVTLLVSSSYRSYSYQVGVWDRDVKAEGELAAAKVIARPGHSQHQLGMAIDFGSIDDSFAQTKASRWLERHAAAYGFSLSYPKGLEPVTGYSWESWHYRYIGKAAAALQEEFFGGIQQYLVVFAEAYWRD